MREPDDRDNRRRRGWWIWVPRLLPVFLAGAFVQFGADRVLSQETSSPSIEVREQRDVSTNDGSIDLALTSDDTPDNTAVEARGVAIDARRVVEEVAEVEAVAPVDTTATSETDTTTRDVAAPAPTVPPSTQAPTTRPPTTRPSTTRPPTTQPSAAVTSTTVVAVAPIVTIEPTIVAPQSTSTTRATTSTTRPTPITGPTVLVITAPPATTTTVPSTTTTTAAPTTTTTAAPTQPGPVISNLRMVAIGSTSADIRFSNQVCTAVRFDYSSPSGDSGAHISAGYPSTNHCWFNHSGQLGNANWGLPPLLPDTDYNVSITVVDEFGQTASSFISFRTNP